MEASEAARSKNPAGWYAFNGGVRYWDGVAWTDHFAYEPPAVRQQISYVAIMGAVAVGMVIGWFLIWVAAQAAPDTFYWPVKFVVNDLPSFSNP